MGYIRDVILALFYILKRHLLVIVLTRHVDDIIV